MSTERRIVLNDWEQAELDGLQQDVINFKRCLTLPENTELRAIRRAQNLGRELLTGKGFVCAHCQNLQAHVDGYKVRCSCRMTDLDVVFDADAGKWSFAVLPVCCR